MDFNVWCILASYLLISAGAARFDQGPQHFSESFSPSSQREQNAGTKEVVLYLTPNQIKALEAGGAEVRPAESEEDTELAPEEARQRNEEEVDVRADQEQEQEQEEAEIEAEQPEQQEEAEQAQEQNQEDQGEDLDLEEILRILNEEKIENEANVEQGRNEPQVTEETFEEERNIPGRFQVRQNEQQQRQEKYLAPADRNSRSKIYAAIRYQQRNETPQRTKVQSPRQQQQELTRNEQQKQVQPQSDTSSQLKRYKLVPYEVEEQPEELSQEQQEQQDQEQQNEEQQQAEEQRTEQEENEEKLSALLSPILSPERLAAVIGQRKNKLFQNEIELQAILQELKQSPKHNDQKYAIEIEKLRANLDKQNTLAKAEAIAKTAPQLIKKEILKRRPGQSAKQAKAPALAARNPEPQRQRAPRPQSEQLQGSRRVPIPIVRQQKVEIERQVEVERRLPVPVTRNFYVKVNKPFLADRIVPVEIRRSP